MGTVRGPSPDPNPDEKNRNPGLSLRPDHGPSGKSPANRSVRRPPNEMAAIKSAKAIKATTVTKLAKKTLKRCVKISLEAAHGEHARVHGHKVLVTFLLRGKLR